jgi:DHA3 family macrolide efflux protein-like MFS transporter
MIKQPTNWSYKAFIFLTGQALSLFGSSIVGYAVIWYITLETSSASLMTIAILCSFLPQVPISLFAGVWADRYNRKLMIILSDLFTAAVTLLMAILLLGGVKAFSIIFIMSALRSIGAGLQMPAVGAILPQIVPTEKLTRVNGINAALNSALMLVSPALGGVLLGTIGLSYTLLVDVVTAAMAVGIMLLLQVEKHKRTEETHSAVAELKNGLQYIKNHPLLWKLLIFYALFFFLIAPAAFLTPIMIERSFGPEIWRLSANEMAWTFGSLVGGIIISLWGGFPNRLATMALSAAGFGITFALLGTARNFYLYLLIMLISGIFMPIFSTAETVLIQESAEESMLGRVFSIIQIIASTIMPLGMVVFGPLGDVVSIESILIGTGLCLTLLAPFILRCRTNQ